MKRNKWILFLIVVFMGENVFFSESLRAMEISIASQTVKQGESAVVPIMMDAVDNLAGVRMTVAYDASLLGFDRAEKTPQTASLLHIVNNKTPGRLIIVMAGAKGIKGEKFSFVTLCFTVTGDVREKKETTLAITDTQFMADTLKELPHKIVSHPLIIVPKDPTDSTKKTPVSP